MTPTVKIGHALVTDGEKDVRESIWFNPGWNKVIRAKNKLDAENIAKAMEESCACELVSYDMTRRTSFFEKVRAYGWSTKTLDCQCYTDCSCLVATCVNMAGIKVSPEMYTGNQAMVLDLTRRFEILTDSRYLTSDKYLIRGDILLKEGKHTAIVLTNGSSHGTARVSTRIKKL